MSSEIRTWHRGLIARWWAEFNEGGDDVEQFRRAIAASGEPALDVACGTGRLLVPLRRAGVDGNHGRSASTNASRATAARSN